MRHFHPDLITFICWLVFAREPKILFPTMNAINETKTDIQAAREGVVKAKSGLDCSSTSSCAEYPAKYLAKHREMEKQKELAKQTAEMTTLLVSTFNGKP